MQAIFECGCCNHYHRLEFAGDCRNDHERLTIEDVVSRFGSEGEGWQELPVCETCGEIGYINSQDCPVCKES